MSDVIHTEREVEALLFAAAGPLSLEDIAKRLPQGADIEGAIAALQDRYAGRGVEVACVAGRWSARCSRAGSMRGWRQGATKSAPESIRASMRVSSYGSTCTGMSPAARAPATSLMNESPT